MRELWLDFGLEEVQLVEVFIARTADGAGKELDAFAEELVIACKVCLGHRLNTTVQWASGIAGSPPSARNPEGTILNPDMRKLISRCAGLETKAMVNSSDTFVELPTSQSLELNSECTIVNDVDVEFEEVGFEDLPPIAQTLVFVLRSKYEAYDLGDPVSREDRICCALHPTFPWIDEEVKAQAFEELNAEVEKAHTCFAKPVVADADTTRDPARSPEQKKVKYSARERYRQSVAKRQLLGGSTTPGSAPTSSKEGDHRGRSLQVLSGQQFV
ncbi:hypothetical protein CYMTET_11651 [Cymbomonas tetramitiformis]|uniref:Uncharacterized protein n=1 Tax=Cymbomonas tetramitiformis TaxID=36881 RepID=A0AAE0GM40_9CHLO|nr:hypothetical protein CYMTET_11651 [Cymbomonas tetramitiformis]